MVRTRFRRSQIGRSEWINLSFAAVSVLGGLFSAFYLFNGAELFRNAVVWPREFLYASTSGLAGQSAVANDASAKERPRGVVAPKTDPTGDPFPHVGGPLTFDRSPYTWAREAGGLPGTLISRLTLLVPGADNLTQALQTAAADLEKNIGSGTTRSPRPS